MNYIRHDHIKAAMVEAAARLQHKLGTVYVIDLLSLKGIPLPVIERVVEGGPMRSNESRSFDWGEQKIFRT